jgi:hypothetical protein
MDRIFRRLATSILPCLLLLSDSVWTQNPSDIPSGTTIRIRMIDKLSSEDAQIGDTFHATLEDPIEVEGKTLYPKGADVMGRVNDVHRTGRLSEPGELDLVLATVSSGTSAASLRVEPLVIKGESHTKSNATKIGGGAVLGAIIGGIAGGGKGAAIGTMAGGAAGAGTAAATGKRPAIVESEAVLTFSTTTASSPTTPPPASTAESNRAPVPSPPPDSDSTPPPASGDSSGPSADNNAAVFTLRDRRIIRNCVSDHASDFPPGVTQRPELPSGSERQIRRGETLSSDLQKQVLSLPLACEEQLPTLSHELERVLYNGRIMLINNKGRILDLFYLEDEQ